MKNSEVQTGSESSQDRPTVANWLSRLPLRTRFGLSVAVSVAIVITLLTILGMRLAERLVDRDLRETARLTAVAVADDAELRLDSDTESIQPVLHDFIAAAPSVRAISVYRADGSTITQLGSTSSSPAAPESLIQESIRTAGAVWQDIDENLSRVATPITHDDQVVGAVVVSVIMTPVAQLRNGGRLLGTAAGLIAIAGITLLIHLLARRLVLAPLQAISGAMARVRDGDLTARAPVSRHDEIGALATDLNEMLKELEDLHRFLNDRVAAATGELRQRNEQLGRSYERVVQLREAVQRAEHLATVGQTMADVAHQIGTPLNLVSGHVQLLKGEAVDPAIRRRLRIVEEQVDRVTATVRTLLERARPDSARQPVSLVPLIDRLFDAIGPRLVAAQVTWHVQIGDTVPRVMADDTQLELVLLNLITNAADAMPDGGTLTIQATEQASTVRLTIQDTGTGVAPELVTRIFDPWVSTKGGQGTGLGLSVARDVIERLGGTILVSSSPGEGSVFTIDLPIATEEALAS